MKKLEEYATPISDSAAFQVRSRGTPMADDVVYQSIARDLERKLAMCRDALQFYAGNFPNDDLGNWQERIGRDEGDRAAYILKATSPTTKS